MTKEEIKGTSMTVRIVTGVNGIKYITNEPFKPRLDQGPDYERGFVDGAQHQMKSSVDLALEAMRIKKWVGLTDEEKHEIRYSHMTSADFIDAIEAKLKQKNGYAEEKNT